MLEIEKKFILTKEQKTRLLDGAKFLRKKRFTDTYYVDPKNELIAKDWWLRQRDSAWELKVALQDRNNANHHKHFDQYEEVTNERDICNRLEIALVETMVKSLKDARYVPIAKIGTIREKYTKDGFYLDIDEADFGYSICEVEGEAKDETGIQQVSKSIETFAKKHDLTIGPVHSKLAEYIRRNDPVRYQLSIDAHIVEAY